MHCKKFWEWPSVFILHGCIISQCVKNVLKSALDSKQTYAKN